MSVSSISPQPPQQVPRLEVKTSDLNHRVTAIAVGVLSSAAILALLPMPGSLVLASVVMLITTSYAMDLNDHVYERTERESPIVVIRERNPFPFYYRAGESLGNRVPVGVLYPQAPPMRRMERREATDFVSAPDWRDREPVGLSNASRFPRDERPVINRGEPPASNREREPVGRR